jgi:hypothetical protein
MIEMHEHPLPGTRTPNKSCQWLATTEVNGEAFTVRSRHGAPMALARLLVAAGVEDQSVRVTNQGLKGHMSYRSLHTMARLTIIENATTPIKLARYVEPDFSLARFAQKGGVSEEDVLEAAE